tara:strand:+ start:227 stop:1393 length:1167 start_codon:yes stop_codon:yes gene_type:complete
MDPNNFFDIQDNFCFETERQNFIDNLDMLKGMSVQEQTLYKKWLEFNKDERVRLNFRKNYYKSELFYKSIWRPTDINNKQLTISEIENLDPIVVEAKDPSEWTLLRTLISSMEFTANPGRNIRFFAKDRTSGKYLGVISVGSDVTSIKVRDDYIKWTKDNKFVDHKLNHTCIGTSIVPTQPLGFNFLGGKLLSALVTTSTIRNKWEENYDEVLVGVTTTSLYGVHSQYNGIPHWKTLGESTGKIAIKPDDVVYKVWSNWLKENHFEEYDKAIHATGPKQNILNRVFRHLGIKPKDYEHGFKRGVFFANMYDNGLEYLRNEITDKDLVMKKKFTEDYDYINNWWKKKAIKRYTKLLEQGRIKDETLFYNDMFDMTWEQAKEKYLTDVGR